MSELQAGVGRSIVTPRLGTKLIGYFPDPRPASDVHDDLNARALVLNDGDITLALCSVEMLWMCNDIIRQVRQQVEARCGLPAEHIFLFATHTHAGPSAVDETAWDKPLVDSIADAIVAAFESQQPVRLGMGFGQLFGYNINRRWLNRPTDPSVGVIRIDRLDGSPLAVFGNYACHAVVMGYDNFLISGDWPGYSSRQLEAYLGEGTVALFGQGGAGDVNPLTETVRQKLAAGHPVGTIGYLTTFYGQDDTDSPDLWNIEDRGGGRFLEAETIARAYNAEVLRIYRAILTRTDVPLWTERTLVDGSLAADEPPAKGMEPHHHALGVDEAVDQVEIMLVGIGEAVLLGQPGEIFSENAVAFRKAGQQLGYGYPMLVSYANGSYAYMPPANAFAEGGYEVRWPQLLGMSRYVQDRITDAYLPILQKHLDK